MIVGMKFALTFFCFVYLKTTVGATDVDAISTHRNLETREWYSFGQLITGDVASDNMGTSVALSADGMIMAVGAPGHDNGATGTGQVKVYRIEDSNWEILGDPLYGPGGSSFGSSVSLSADGTFMAVGLKSGDVTALDSGSMHVYRWNSTSWELMSVVAHGLATNDYLGTSVSISKDGTVVAVGAPDNQAKGNGPGYVMVFKFDGSNWNQMGGTLNGDATLNEFGYSVSLSADGTVLVVGAPHNGAAGVRAGRTRVFKFDGSSWVNNGNIINGFNAGDLFGYSVSISNNGTIIAVGAITNSAISGSSGQVRVLKLEGTQWVQLGNNINGQVNNAFLGYSTSISADGTVVAVGAIGYDVGGTDTGKVQVYELVGDTWVQNGIDLNGDSVSGQFGNAVALSSDGTVVAAGAYRSSVNGNRAGEVKSFEFAFPPTPAPTGSPTLECYETPHCSEPNEICDYGNSCVAHTCSKHGDCFGVMLPGRAGRCSSGGFCVDSHSSNCDSPITCTAEVNRRFVSANSLGESNVQVANSNITKVVEATKGILDGIFNTSTGELYTLLNGTYSATFGRALWDFYNDDNALLQHIKDTICGDIPCTITKADFGAGRRLQASGEVGVVVSFSIDSVLLDQLLKVNAFQDPQFIQSLAAAAGVNETDVEITTSSGSIVMTIQVAEESTGDDPLEEEALAAIEAFTSSVGTIADTLTQLLSLSPDTISISGVDKCGGRDCNGRGTCSPTTGVCSCQQGWWGVNCETAIVCTNGGSIHPTTSYCTCPYPFWGKRCVSTRDECSGGSCV